MAPANVNLSHPVVHGDSLWFAAYEFGWGYRAFEIHGDTVQAKLGAADTSPRQLMLAFELGRPRITKAVMPMTFEYRGERIVLHATDLNAERLRRAVLPSGIAEGTHAAIVIEES
ncbi:conserved hypothetical protein [Paraburkholderia piptadeniae]|uniref:Uncharacterized protein n=1 Tax=Paraburkholderia piptadeniae TaxID=1701573 RepID=A0A1N7SW13_9BURK|nr:hypothetical protein [Paraburkholderia piptadeniae]SIT51600.1 conserved hypothetical protein [Paraburkholderia piptadeniae]